MLTKHHKAFAKIVKDRSGDRLKSESKEIAQCMAIDLADYFEEQHSDFNRQEFFKACGIV